MRQPNSASKRFARGAALLLAALLAVPAYAAAQAPPAAQAVAAAPAAAAAAEDYSYGGMGRRDPFKSLLVLQEKVRDISLLPPIQQVDLASFKVVGIIIDQAAGNRAMVQAPDGRSYVVRKGDIMGKNDGEVMAIDMGALTVRERYLDFMGKETVVTTVLKVTDKQK